MTNNLSHAGIRKCQKPDCRFRFPDTNDLYDSIGCPSCGLKVVIK